MNLLLSQFLVEISLSMTFGRIADPKPGSTLPVKGPRQVTALGSALSQLQNHFRLIKWSQVTLLAPRAWVSPQRRAHRSRVR